MKLQLITVALALAATAASASAQTVYQGIRYQYGQYGEVYYGGTNPTYTGAIPYTYLPHSLQAYYNIRRTDDTAWTTPYPTPFTPYGAGTSFYSPYTQDDQTRYAPHAWVFSDYAPYEEVGRYGYTIADARNEAYANVPRIQTGGPAHAPTHDAAAPEHAASPQPVVPELTPEQIKAKAIPLLNWARAEKTRNVPLYNALIKEATKYDPDAVAKFTAAESSSENKATPPVPVAPHTETTAVTEAPHTEATTVAESPHNTAPKTPAVTAPQNTETPHPTAQQPVVTLSHN